MAIVPSINKQELLSQLYVFRGVLGWLFLEKKKCDDDNEDTMNEANAVYQNAKNAYNRAAENKDNSVRYINSKIDEIKNGKSYAEDEARKQLSEEKQEERDKASRAVDIVLKIIFIAIGIIGLGIALKYIYDYSLEYEELGPMIVMMIILGGIAVFVLVLVEAFIICIIINPICGIIDRIKIERVSDRAVKERYVENTKIEGTSAWRYVQNKKNLPGAKDELEKAKAVLDEKKKDLEKAESVVANAKHRVYQREKEFEQIKGAVAQTFAGFLLEVDWPMVDTIFYMVASGRANTMQEALNYGDLEVRHEQVMNMFGVLKNTIYNGFAETSLALKDICISVNNICNKCESILEATYGMNSSIQEVRGSIIDMNMDMNDNFAMINDTIKFMGTCIDATVRASSKELVQKIS